MAKKATSIDYDWSNLPEFVRRRAVSQKLDISDSLMSMRLKRLEITSYTRKDDKRTKYLKKEDVAYLLRLETENDNNAEFFKAEA